MKRILFFLVLIAALAAVWFLWGNDEKKEALPNGEDSLSSSVLGEREANQTVVNTNVNEETELASVNNENTEQFKRYVWISYLDLADIISDDKVTFLKNADEMAMNLESLKITDVFLQVRQFGDAIYPSEFFISAGNTVYSNYSEDIDYLLLLLERFHKSGIRVHAWINPYRLKAGENESVSSFTEALIEKDVLSVVEFEDSLTLNPASEETKSLVVNGVKEILNNYDVDGVHFDDYFYPTSAEEYDAYTYAKFLENGGMMSLSDFRRDNVSRLISEVYETVKAKDEEIEFGISPDASIERDFSSHYANVQLWCNTKGYIDYICPQIYFGYENEYLPFSPTLKEWSELCETCDLIVGLSFYKAGTEDIYAGNGKEEWTKSFDIISRQYKESKEIINCKGIALYRYNSIFKPDVETASYASVEMYNLIKVIE